MKKQFNAHLDVMLGDLHYSDVVSGHYRDHLAAFEEQFATVPAMADSYANVATVTMGSDHDWDGGGNAEHGGEWTPASIKAYKRAFPYLPIPVPKSAEARCGTLMAGRTRLIFVDTRSGARTRGNRSNDPRQTALGQEQLAWVRQLLQEAVTDENVRHVAFFTDFVWGGTRIHKKDAWCCYQNERGLLATDMAAITAAGKNGTIIQGDNHGGFGDDGTNNPYGGWEILGCCGMHQRSGNARGDLVYQREYPPRGQHEPIQVYGQVTLRDDGATISTTLELLDASTGTVGFTVGNP